jgi:hypothetical protein
VCSIAAYGLEEVEMVGWDAASKSNPVSLDGSRSRQLRQDNALIPANHMLHKPHQRDVLYPSAEISTG